MGFEPDAFDVLEDEYRRLDLRQTVDKDGVSHYYYINREYIRENTESVIDWIALRSERLFRHGDG